MKNIFLLFFTSMLLMVLSNDSIAQAPNLGTAADFVLFSSIGAVSNSGHSILIGNVGTNNGSSTAFGNVNGGMHDGDAASAQCSADVLTAYNQLSATVATFFPASLLGNNQILVPGVYSIPSAATLNLDLSLNGQGNSSSVFIIKIEGAFSANSGARVKLMNGALACNVFWKVEGLISIASGSSIKGTFIANNAAINMSTGDTLEGRALTTSGAVTVDGIYGYTPIGCGSPNLTGPIAPALGSSECYSIFSSNGPVADAGNSFAVGDVGSNVGLTTNFNSLNVTGLIHANPDPSTVQCAADLLVAYNYVNGISADIELLYPNQFGSNLILTPHTYVMNGAAVLTDSVYLDAENNSNAVFIIKTYGAFSTSVGSHVFLINGAQAKNVYWMVNGAVSINNLSIFNGTLICYGAIDLLQGMVMNGRALTVDGALTTDAVNVTMPSGCSTGAPNISTQPVNQIGCAGTAVHFSVVAHGTGLSYQWRKGTVNLINTGNISGANAAILTISPANVSDVAVNYNVVVTGSVAPAVASLNVSLAINSAPVIVTAPTSQIACVGTGASFSVNATGSGLTYHWRKGTVNLVNNGTITGATSLTLSINPVSLSDTSAHYNVMITGICATNSLSGDVSLTVNAATLISTQPLDQNICVGQLASFPVVASGTNLTYQWRKGNLALSNGGNIFGVNSSTLIINPVIYSDSSSNYNVLISGTCSAPTSSTDAVLSVCSASGISDASNTNNESLVIYPNPFSSSFALHLLNPALSSNSSVRIYNVLGEMVMNVTVSGQKQIFENVLPSGIYFYKLICDDKTIQSGRLVSQK